MYSQETTIDYITYDSKHNSVHDRSCIDGTITGSGNCVAYCKYEGHPGFLTEKLRVKHKCIEKGCLYYLPKPKKKKTRNNSENNEQKKIMEVSTSVTSDMEGIRIMRADRDEDGIWVVYYIAISNYLLDSFASKVEEETGTKVKFVDLEYRFEIAAEIIFGIRGA